MNKFADFNLSTEILKGISKMGFEEPSPIQAQCIPVGLGAKDIIGQAQTGTGKTAAFGIPLLEKIDPKQNKIQSIILTPTRELAIQVSNELTQLALFKRVKILPVYGGQSIGKQLNDLRRGVQVIVGTPGRVLDHLRRKSIRTDDVKMFVLDEADEMLAMGFIDDIVTVLKMLSDDCQKLLFSATMPREIRNIANKHLNSPEYIAINKKEITVPVISQRYYRVLESLKPEALIRLIDSEEIDLGIIFCRTKKGVDDLTEKLQRQGYLASGLHGDLVQQQRDRVMKSFRDEKVQLLVATDVAARGIDVENISHVVNYDIPQDVESYIHRIGRTGRAGRKGIAITLATPGDLRQIRLIERHISMKLRICELPTIDEVAEKQRLSWVQRIEKFLEKGSNELLFTDMVEEMATKYSPAQIAAAVLEITFRERFAQHDSGSSTKFQETGASPGMVRFFVSLGKSNNIKPQDITNAIVEQASIAKQEIGRISIYDRFSFVELTENVAPFVYGAFRKGKIKGIRMSMDLAQPKRKGTREH